MAVGAKIPFSVDAVDAITGRLRAGADATVTIKLINPDGSLGADVTIYSDRALTAILDPCVTDAYGRIAGFVAQGIGPVRVTAAGGNIIDWWIEWDVPMVVAGGFQDTSEKGQPNGYAGLDGTGKVPAGQLPGGAQSWQGLWNAATNTPALAAGAGTPGDTYRVSVEGTRNLGLGQTDFEVGDYIVYNGAAWEKYTQTLDAELRHALAGEPDALLIGDITRDANDAVTAADVVWPDGTVGVFTGTPSGAFPGAVDAYDITYGTHTYTQPAVTRNADGAVTHRPAIVVT